MFTGDAPFHMTAITISKIFFQSADIQALIFDACYQPMR